MNRLRTFLGAALIISATTKTTLAQGTAFTYQGRLNAGASVASGNYDLRFALFDAVSGGAQQGNALTNAATAISNGLFTVTLDFGDQFPGAGRWLELGVRTNGIGAFATLSPRQQLRSAPYALRAANATTANSASSVAAANITGTIPLAQLPSTVVTNGASGVNLTGTFSGNGAGVTNVDVRTLRQLLGTVAAWGLDLYNQTTIPAGLDDVVAIAGGGYHSLALRSDGTVVAWGNNSDGQTNIPAGLSNVVAIAGGGYHSLALRSDGTAVAWGRNASGQTTIPAGLSNVVAIAGGEFHSLALRSNGTVAAWGLGNFGQTTIPTGLSNVVAIAGGTAHSLALRSNGTVAAWGNNQLGQTNIPAGLSNVVAIAAGEFYNLALRSDGTVAAWGDNQLGQTNIPAGLSNVVAIAAGNGALGLALRSDGTVAAWVTTTTIPAGLSNVVAIAAGLGHGLALRRQVVPAQVALLTGNNVFQGSVTAASFSGNGAGLTNFNASQLTSGTVNDARLSANVSRLGASIESAEITDGAIMNADINTNAAIADTKLATISTAGKVADTALSANVALRSGGNTFSSDQVINGGLYNFGGQIVRPSNPGYAATTEWASTNDNSGIRAIVGTAGYGLTPTTNHMFVGTYSPHPVGFYVNAVQRMTVDTSGNIGIGTPNPPNRLTVDQGSDLNVGSAGSYGMMVKVAGADKVALGGDAGAAHIQSWSLLPLKINAAGNDTLINPATGNVGIGTTSPTNRLHVIGGVSATAFVTTSDRNAKENFASVSPLEVLSKVTALPITTWNFKDLKDGRHMGPMAQDFYAAFGLGGGKTTITSVDPDGVALAAIQGLNQKVESEKQKAEIQIRELKDENAELKTRLEKLEQLMSGGAKGGAK